MIGRRSSERRGRGNGLPATVTCRDRLRRGGTTALTICAIAVLYYISARLGLLQHLVRGQVTPLWPATGISLAALLLLGPRIWPGIALGALLTDITLGPSVPGVLAITAGDTLAPLCSYALLRAAGFRTELNRFRDALVLVFLGAFAGMLTSATVGTGTLYLARALPAGGFWPAWWVWWAGDAMGVLLVAPVLLALRSARWPKNVPPSRWVEGAFLATATLGIGLLQIFQASFLFLTFPVVVWAAFRFQRAGAAPCALAVSTFAVLAATRRSGPFAGHSLLTNMVVLQAFNGAASLTALLIGAAVTERNQTLDKVEQACKRLSEMAARITPDTNGPPALGDDGRPRQEENDGRTHPS
ncbi:MASE1 domain-containing protein [Streptomyces nodosus]|uniref:MASE1 domain-containing protein n=1 Tax=Streptomyces nodosus TaxID=40318 RepID=UPI001822E20E|nr:integral membrane sensor domain MASE1 [Streptomyces nodosus]